tara:strand:- start:649 stop:948 length:300 start_codon:yes stop_codon:yes gene_type:complete
MGAQARFYIQYLKGELKGRIEKNPAYSLRAFAKNIQVDPSLLSRVLNRKEHFTIVVAEGVAEQLKLDFDTKKKFVQSVADGRACRSIYKVAPELTDCQE